MSSKLKVRGFTLIEILVAAVILFFVTTTGLLAYNSAMQVNRRVAARYEMMRPITMIVDNIRSRVRSSDERNGSGQVGTVRFEWTSELLQKSPPPPRFDPNKAVFADYNPRYELILVTLNLYLGEYQHTVEYKEVAWQPDVTIKTDSR